MRVDSLLRLPSGSCTLATISQPFFVQDEERQVPDEFQPEEQDDGVCDQTKWQRPALERDVDPMKDTLGAI